MRALADNDLQELPLPIVGSTKFGRYPIVSNEETLNMIISDGFLVPFAGYSIKVSTPGDEGRGLYTSNIHGIMVAVINDRVYEVTADPDGTLFYSEVGQLNTTNGVVYIDENINNQIAICDLEDLWLYNPIAATFTQVSISFMPGYITYQDTRFIAPALGSANWRLSDPSDGATWDAANASSIQTKPDNVVATLRMPGRGNTLLVFGENVTELWQDVGAQLFPYQRLSSMNIDYGCLNAATIANNTNYVVWLGANEKSGPTIMYTEGNDIQRISTDGIDFQLAQLQYPANAYAFFFRQDGHDIYQITWPYDNVTYAYDFNTKSFFTITDHNQNYHPATRIAFFNDTYYFVSNSDGNIYEMSTKYTNYETSVGVFSDIPRVRVCPNIRLPNGARFSAVYTTILIEQGFNYTDNLAAASQVPQRVILTISTNGGYNYGSGYSKDLNSAGNYKNRLRFWNLGSANDLICQYRFYGLDRYVVGNGTIGVRS